MEPTEHGPKTSLVQLDCAAVGVFRLRMRDWEGNNGLSASLVDGLLAALRVVQNDDGARVLMLCGLQDHFCSGATRGVLESLSDGRIHPTELGLARHILELEIPVIAACAGAAIGGGFVLATACDMVMLARERRYGFNFMDLGITPGMGVTTLAEHILGRARTHELLYTGEFRLGGQFISAPGVATVVPSREVEIRALDVALRIAGKPRRNIAMLKRTLTMPRRRALVEALTLESLMHETSLAALDRTAIEEAQ